MQQDCWHTTDMDPFAWDSLFMLHLPECTTPVTPDCTKGMLPTHLILSLGAAVCVGVATLCLFEAMGKWDVGSPTLPLPAATGIGGMQSKSSSTSTTGSPPSHKPMSSVCMFGNLSGSGVFSGCLSGRISCTCSWLAESKNVAATTSVEEQAVDCIALSKSYNNTRTHKITLGLGPKKGLHTQGWS